MTVAQVPVGAPRTIAVAPSRETWTAGTADQTDDQHDNVIWTVNLADAAARKAVTVNLNAAHDAEEINAVTYDAAMKVDQVRDRRA